MVIMTHRTKTIHVSFDLDCSCYGNKNDVIVRDTVEYIKDALNGSNGTACSFCVSNLKVHSLKTYP